MRVAKLQINPQGFIMSWPSEAESLFGWSFSSAIGQPWTTFLLMDEPSVPNGYPFDASAVCRDGTVFPVEVIKLPVSGELLIIDVNELHQLRTALAQSKRLIDALKRSESFIDALLESIPHMIFVKDAQELKFVRFNRAGEELLGMSREEMIGRSDFDFFSKSEADFFTGKDREVLRQKKSLDIPQESIHTRKKGLRILHTKKVPIHDLNGYPLYLLGISEDITELQLAKDMAERAMRWREELLAIISHDLRNPISAILLAAKTLRLTGKDLPDTSVQSLQRISRAAEVIENLIRDILDLGQIEKGRLKIEPSELDAVSVLNEAIDLFRPIAAERAIELTLSPTPSACVIQADRKRLHQVMSNLIGNAIKFTPRGGTVEVRLERAGSHLARFTIRDTGPGIPQEEIPHIFKPYWRGGNKESGAGLGLAIAKGIVESHGGAIEARSGPGTGTTVSFTLPFVAAKAA